MSLVTIYCVQPFRKVGRKLTLTEPRQFKKPDEALRAGEAAGRRWAGVLVYSVEGSPESDDWGEPKILATHGQTPPAI